MIVSVWSSLFGDQKCPGKRGIFVLRCRSATASLFYFEFAPLEQSPSPAPLLRRHSYPHGPCAPRDAFIAVNLPAVEGGPLDGNRPNKRIWARELNVPWTRPRRRAPETFHPPAPPLRPARPRRSSLILPALARPSSPKPLGSHPSRRTSIDGRRRSSTEQAPLTCAASRPGRAAESGGSRCACTPVLCLVYMPSAWGNANSREKPHAKPTRGEPTNAEPNAWQVIPSRPPRVARFLPWLARNTASSSALPGWLPAPWSAVLLRPDQLCSSPLDRTPFSQPWFY